MPEYDTAKKMLLPEKMLLLKNNIAAKRWSCY